MQIVCATSLAAEEVQESEVFKNWTRRVQDWDGITQVTVADAFHWNGAYRMLLLRISYNGQYNAVLLRGSTVDILTVLTCDTRTYLVHVDQPRVAVGQIVRSNAAGMVDDNEDVAVAALRELGEEVDVSLDWGEPINLNEAVYGVDLPELGTPGGSDEDVTFFAVHVEVTPEDLVKLQGRVAGLADEGEQTVVRLTEFQGRAANVLPQLVVDGNRPDMKAAHSVLLYDEAMRLSSPKD